MPHATQTPGRKGEPGEVAVVGGPFARSENRPEEAPGPAQPQAPANLGCSCPSNPTYAEAKASSAARELPSCVSQPSSGASNPISAAAELYSGAAEWLSGVAQASSAAEDACPTAEVHSLAAEDTKSASAIANPATEDRSPAAELSFQHRKLVLQHRKSTFQPEHGGGMAAKGRKERKAKQQGGWRNDSVLPKPSRSHALSCFVSSAFFRGQVGIRPQPRRPVSQARIQ